MVFQLFMLLRFLYNVYAFPVYVDTNICLINGDVKDFDGVKDILLKKTVCNFLYCK